MTHPSSSWSVPRRFTGRALREIAFPLGGIGTGTVSLGGRGQWRDWEIFNRPAKGNNLPYSFPAIWAQAEGGKPVAKVLEARLQPPYSGAFGLPFDQAAGLPRLAEARFTGAYPFAWIDFEDPALPGPVRLEAFNPFIPLDPDDSGLPVALLRYMLTNQTAQHVSVSIASTLLNPIGTDGTERFTNRRSHPCLGGNRNEFIDTGSLRGLRLSSNKYPPDSPRFGTMALVTPHPDVTWRTSWPGEGWWNDILHYWDDFRADGQLDRDEEAPVSPEGQSHYASLCLSVTLEPGASATLPFYLTWHFPNLVNTWNSEDAVRGKPLGNYYATRFADAWEVAEYVEANLPRLEAGSRRYCDALLDSTLPPAVIDAAMSNVSTLRTTTGLRTADGAFHGFEGCRDDLGCCPMDCTHVWNYEQATAFLFPTLAQSLRRTEFQVNLLENGAMCFRTLLPPGADFWRRTAADGQMGCVMKLYRDWQLSGDRAFLEELWPAAKRALEFAWEGWDADRDGVMEGEQHNTYDVEFYGPNPMMGAWYLGALRAGEEMARALGETDQANEYRSLFERGRAWLDANLFNGEYYEQQIRPPGDEEPLYQVGSGCLVDQLVGQYFAHVADLGHLLDPEHVKTTAASIFRHNFRPDLSGHWNTQRTYALNDEAALLICTWPRGGRPRVPFPYFTEVMTGFEYQAAVLMLYEGLIEEGLTVVESIRARYDGERRNPWDEAECGHHYARAMASWAALLALSGFHYSAPARTLTLAPLWQPEDFHCFWSVPSGWGVFRQQATGKEQTVTAEVYAGKLKLQTLRLRPLFDAWSGATAEVTVGERHLDAKVEPVPPRVEVRLSEEVTVAAGQTLTVRSSFAIRNSQLAFPCPPLDNPSLLW